MICPNCGSQNVTVQVVTNVTTRNRGCLGWIFWILLAFLTFGIILIIPLATNRKVVSEMYNEAVCQNCGYRWVL